MEPDPIESRAAELLTRLAGPDASFRDGQLEAIRAVLEGRRTLVVQRTGWGKSAVYFIASKLLRERGAGPLLVLSPLLVLMRNQVAAAEKLGLSAVTINSSLDPRERATALKRATTADLLFVTPETLQAGWFREDVLAELKAQPSGVVVDEVHCISEWGHDFRPKYRRVRQFLEQLPTGHAVLGTTATANSRTVEDIAEQLGDDLLIVRGSLARPSLRLHVVPPAPQPWRLAWLARFVPDQAGAGIVYCLTKHDTERIADWLVDQRIAAAAYHGGMEDEDRRAIEHQLEHDLVDAVVATTALGMGYDKPDLTWVVHYQAPAGPVAYYQQVGRAGRAVDDAVGVLMRGDEDDAIHDWFIENSYPAKELAGSVLAELDGSASGLTQNELLARLNVRASRLDAALVILEDDGVVLRDGPRWHRTVKEYEYPERRVAELAAARRREYESLVRFTEATTCIFEELQRLLDDPAAAPCGKCGPCSGGGLDVDVPPELVDQAARFLWRSAGILEPRKRWPRETMGLLPAGNIAGDRRLEVGRVLGRYQDGGYGSEALRSRDAGTPSTRLIEGACESIARWAPQPAPTWMTYVPSRSHDGFVLRFAEMIADRLRLPLHPVLSKAPGTPPQQGMMNSQQAARNAWQTLAVDADQVREGPVLLVDDVVNTKWTMAVAGHRLRNAGSGPVHPFVLCEWPGASS